MFLWPAWVALPVVSRTVRSERDIRNWSELRGVSSAFTHLARPYEASCDRVRQQPHHPRSDGVNDGKAKSLRQKPAKFISLWKIVAARRSAMAPMSLEDTSPVATVFGQQSRLGWPREREKVWLDTNSPLGGIIVVDANGRTNFDGLGIGQEFLPRTPICPSFHPMKPKKVCPMCALGRRRGRAVYG